MQPDSVRGPAKKTCRCPGCHEAVAPGEAHYPYCSSRCYSRAGELHAEELSVKPVRVGQVIPAEARGGGVIARAAVVEGVLVRKGDVSVFVPRAAIIAALALLDGRPRKVNGHER